jgi:titin
MSTSDVFAAYRIFRSETVSVDSLDEPIATLSTSNTTEWNDIDVVEGHTYAYRLYLRDTFGLETGSNIVTATVPNVRPPSTVSLYAPEATSSSEIALSWGAIADRDFQAYRIYRNETGAVTDADSLIAEVTDSERTFWDDRGLRENTHYYYRIYVVDQAGLTARSNGIEAVTENEPPPAVVLQAAADVDTTGATLTWTASAAHDFDAYRLYRNDIETVTTTATLVAEFDDESFTSYRDTSLEANTTYYYRIFVVDDAADPELTGSNTIAVETLAIPEGVR